MELKCKGRNTAPIRKVLHRTISSDTKATLRFAIKRKAIKPSGRGARRVPCCIAWPRAYTAPVTAARRREGGRRNPSITNTAQWYLDKRYPSKGSTGLVYALPKLPPSHSAKSVVDALDAAVAALELAQSKAESPAVWDTPEELWGPHNAQLCTSTLSTSLENTSTTTDPLLDLSIFPSGNTSRPSQAEALFRESIVETKQLPHPGPPNLLAPFLPLPPNLRSEAGPHHLSLVPDSRYPPFRNDRTQSQPQLRKKEAMKDLKARTVMLPQLSKISPQRTPTCLQVGSPVTAPVTTRTPLARDSLKIRVPKGRKEEDLPESLQARASGSGLGRGLDATKKCSITDAAARKDGFNPQLEPFGADLGKFTCDFPSISFGDSSRGGRGVVQGEKPAESMVLPSKSGSSSSALAYTSQPSTAPTNYSSPRSTQKQGNARYAGTTKDLQPLPPIAERMKAGNADLRNATMSNATLKALLAAEDEANHSKKEMQERIASKRLSDRSAAVVQGFRDFTHRSFFPPPQEARSQSDGTLWPQAPAQNRAADAVAVQKRAASETSLALRKKKGRGIVFADDGPWKALG